MLSEEQLWNGIRSYEAISNLLKEVSREEIIGAVANLCRVEVSELIRYPMGGYNKERVNGVYLLVLDDLLRNIEKYDWVYSRLEDDISKEVFTNLIRFRLIPDISFIEAAYDGTAPQYFDKNIVSCTADEVFVDCGGFIGDSALKFMESFGDYKSIYVYEPSADNFTVCTENLSAYENIHIRKAGVGERNAVMKIGGSGSSSSFLSADKSADQVPVLSLDEDIQEPVTFIKMDVEGSEIAALLGAKKHIREDYPKLAICTYHILSDIWEIPMLLHMIRPDYCYYYRHYMKDRNWETVLYAIPRQQSKQTPEKIHRVVAMAPYERPWSNVELVKDCGLIPYLLYKNHGCDVSMVGAKGGEYPYAALVEGMKLEFLEDGSVPTKVNYILKYGTEIDCLILRGCYDTNFEVAKTYKRVNPSGKIYVGLDANSHWMDRILWDEKEFSEFMDCCDVIATSCTAMQQYLNEKWPWHIQCIPNGYYNLFALKDEKIPFSEKQPVILTVGRLGTLQKQTEVLLEAFAKIAADIPDWKLRLVGSIEKQFVNDIEQYFAEHPELKERVTFTGPLQDRQQLQKEYQNAKIFALPSLWEGGTPNVVAEALWAGCAMAVTKFDAYTDAIGNGSCGKAAELADAEDFANTLRKLCTEADLEQMSADAQAYGREFLDMEKIVGGLYEQLCI